MTIRGKKGEITLNSSPLDAAIEDESVTRDEFVVQPAAEKLERLTTALRRPHLHGSGLTPRLG